MNWGPVQALLSVWTEKMLYWTLQDDKIWKFSFARGTFGEVREHFETEALRGITGRSNWTLLLPCAGSPAVAGTKGTWCEPESRGANCGVV